MQTQLPNGAAAATANPNAPEGEDGSPDGDGLGPVQLLERRISGEIERAREDLGRFTKNDQSYRRKDTVEVVKDAMRRIKDAAHEVNQ